MKEGSKMKKRNLFLLTLASIMLLGAVVSSAFSTKFTGHFRAYNATTTDYRARYDFSYTPLEFYRKAAMECASDDEYWASATCRTFTSDEIGDVVTEMTPGNTGNWGFGIMRDSRKPAYVMNWYNPTVNGTTYLDGLHWLYEDGYVFGGERSRVYSAGGKTLSDLSTYHNDYYDY